MVVTKRLKNGAWNLDKTHRTLFNPSPGRFYFVLRRQLFSVWQQVLTLLDTPPAEPHLVLGWSLRFGAGSLAYAKLPARAYGAFLYAMSDSGDSAICNQTPFAFGAVPAVQ